MRSILLLLIGLSAAAGQSYCNACWEDLGMDSTACRCITWDDNGSRILVGTAVGFHYYDLSSSQWTNMDETGMMGRGVSSIDAGSTVPEIIITGRSNAFFKGYIDVSFNLGLTWDYMYMSNGGAFWALQEDISTPGKFYCGGISDITPGELMVTEDNGQTWTAITKPQEAISDITQAPDGTLYTCGVPYVYKTEDGGITWTAASGGLNPSTVFFSIAADGSDPDNLVCSDEQGMYRTTDGGAGWTQVSAESCRNIEYDPEDPSRLAAVADAGIVLGSTDGGQTWFDISGDLPGLPRDVAFCGEDHNLYCTTLYHGTYRTPGGFTGVTEGYSETSMVPVLSISPNPCAGTALASYSIPSAGNLRLDILDISGRLIMTAENEYMSCGLHNSVVRLPVTLSGILFVRLTTDSGIASAKLILCR
ncbi:MAG: T9SS type A sorting domain-containing protein [Candidatus Fermentibacteraceae bacterium]|nr:T9SS type A sorting domain-containing protein [Candidatus Fermentibacteraceae bacterium]MBN2609156.1 T9SS type A sorting domain-containing protein [Candidatus Fermentibacteraceae bacterium]